MADETDPADKDFKIFTATAKRLGLAGDEATKYVHEHMTKLGYGHKRSYFTKKQSGSKPSGGWFGGGGSSDDDDDDI